MDYLNKIFWFRIKEAWMGRREYKKLCRIYDITDNIQILILPHTDRELNYYAMCYVEEYIKKIHASGVFVLTVDDWVIRYIRDSKNNVMIRGIWFPRDKMEYLIRYYCGYRVDNITVVSLEKPYWNRNYALVGQDSFTVEDIVCYCIYTMFDVPKIGKKCYEI